MMSESKWTVNTSSRTIQKDGLRLTRICDNECNDKTVILLMHIADKLNYAEANMPKDESLQQLLEMKDQKLDQIIRQMRSTIGSGTRYVTSSEASLTLRTDMMRHGYSITSRWCDSQQAMEHSLNNNVNKDYEMERISEDEAWTYQRIICAFYVIAERDTFGGLHG